MNYDWTEFRREELRNWKAELELTQKSLEVEMEKHQKIREKYRLRFQVALHTQAYLSPADYEKAIALHKKKQDQVNQNVQLKLQNLIQQLETINAFKKAINNALESDPLDLMEFELNTEKKSPPKKGAPKKGHPKMKLSNRKVLQDG